MSEKEHGVEKKRHSGLVLFLRDAGVAALIVASMLLAMFAYTGQWPPLVVVESDSMMHNDDNLSELGVIDTGDMVLVKRVDDSRDIITYAEGFVTGHRSYGEYGDVVIYKVNGLDDRTPIIHRAMIYLEVNPDGASYRCDALRLLPADKWYSSGANDTWDHLTGILVIRDVDYMGRSLVVDISHLGRPLRSGYITKGDHNSMIDSSCPVKLEWVVGKARGEIPWFGLLKLWSTDTLGSPAPQNSVRNLWISIAIIVIAPIAIDAFLTYREKRSVTLRRAESPHDDEHAEQDDKETEGEDDFNRPTS
ncbi:MAG: S26 family signal peptidase [Thermoplasmata archaeon]